MIEVHLRLLSATVVTTDWLGIELEGLAWAHHCLQAQLINRYDVPAVYNMTIQPLLNQGEFLATLHQSDIWVGSSQPAPAGAGLTNATVLLSLKTILSSLPRPFTEVASHVLSLVFYFTPSILNSPCWKKKKRCGPLGGTISWTRYCLLSFISALAG